MTVQKPAQQIPRPRRRQRAEPGAIEAPGDDRALRVILAQRVEELAGFGLERCRARKRHGKTGKIRGQRRRDLVAQEVAPVTGVVVAFVHDPRDAALRTVRCERVPREIEQRPPERRGAGLKARHRRQTARAGTAQKLQQHGLGLVVGVMGKRDHAGIDSP